MTDRADISPRSQNARYGTQPCSLGRSDRLVLSIEAILSRQLERGRNRDDASRIPEGERL